MVENIKTYQHNENSGNYSNLIKYNNNNNNHINNNLESKNSSSPNVIIHKEEHKPIPPPIETIPGKKLPEKRQRPTLPKLYFKSNIGLHQKSQPVTPITAPHNIISTPPKDVVEPQSPLFHIRWVGKISMFCEVIKFKLLKFFYWLSIFYPHMTSWRHSPQNTIIYPEFEYNFS